MIALGFLINFFQCYDIGKYLMISSPGSPKGYIRSVILHGLNQRNLSALTKCVGSSEYIKVVWSFNRNYLAYLKKINMAPGSNRSKDLC